MGNGEKIAHAREGAPHLLDDHLKAVAKLAESFAEPFGNGDWAKTAGLWHDLGKYKDDFQEYIRRVTGYDRDEAREKSQFSHRRLENWSSLEIGF